MADNYAKSCKDRFESKGFEPEQPWLERTVISVGEKGKKYSVQVARPNISASFQIDGHAIKDGAKCDKLVIALHGDDRGTTVFVELKGKDIAHAIDQLENTLANNLFRPLPSKKDMVRARIVTGGCGPASAAKSIMERAKIRFRKNYNCDLRILKNGQPDKDAI